VLFCGYSPAAFKLFVFTVSACLAGVAGALYVGQVGIITPARIGVLPSIEMIIWVAVGGRGTLIGPIVGAFGVNWLQSVLTTHYPDLWILVLGGLFVSVVLFFPDGVVGTAQKLMARFGMTTAKPAPAPPVASPHPAAMPEGKREEVAP
jgi:ABC-type branched-chain amino acid transport system, permease component